MITTDGRPLHGLVGPRARRAVGLLLVGVLALLCSGPAVGFGGGKVPPEDPSNPSLLQGAIVTTGRSEALPGKQYFRLPASAFYVRAKPRDDGLTGVIVDTFAISPTSVGPNYGVLPSTRIRTLVFGLAPAVITLQLAQVVNGRGFIEPWVLEGEDVFLPGLENHLEGRVNVKIASLEVDGQPVQIGSGCQTARPAELELDGEPGYTSALGGELVGTLDVPRFVNCGGSNDRLLTSAVSGSGNPLEITQSIACFSSCPPDLPPTPPPYDLPDDEPPSP